LKCESVIVLLGGIVLFCDLCTFVRMVLYFYFKDWNYYNTTRNL